MSTMCMHRAVVWGLFVFGTLLATPNWAQRLTIDVVPGFDGVRPSDGCYPVTVHIQGQRENVPPVVGEIELTASDWNMAQRVRKRVTLSGGTVSHSTSLALCTPFQPNEYIARLIVNRRVVAEGKSEQSPFALRHPIPFLVGLGTDSSALAALRDDWLGFIVAGRRLVPANKLPTPQFPGAPPTQEDVRGAYVGRSRLTRPPENYIAYRGVHAISLDDRAWDTLNELQQRALVNYVLSGGLLLVTGVDTNRLQSLLPSGLLPVEPLGLSQVPASALAGWMPSLRDSSALVDVVLSRPLGRSKVLLQYGQVPLVVAAEKGFGQVVFLAFDPAQPPLGSATTARDLWKRLLRLHIGRFAPPLLTYPEENVYYPIGYGPPGTIYFYTMLLNILIAAVSKPPAPLEWLALYLGVYVLVLIPLNYLVLRKWDRLQWSWLTLPLLAVLTSAAGYVAASHVQAREHQMREITVVMTKSAQPYAVVENDNVLFSARSTRFEIRATVPSLLTENSPRQLQAQHAVEIPQEEIPQFIAVPIAQWSARTFHLSGVIALQGTVNISARLQNNTLYLRVQNMSPYTLRKVRVATLYGIYSTNQDIKAGAQATVIVHLRQAHAPQPQETWPDGAIGRWEHLLLATLRGAREVSDNPKPMAPPPSPMAPPYLDNSSRLSYQPTDIKGAVLIGELVGFPQVLEVKPLPQQAVQRVKLMAVYFDVPGGK